MVDNAHLWVFPQGPIAQEVPALREEISMSILTRKTDHKARLTLPSDFASCLVTIERQGDELRVRKAKAVTVRRYSFKQLMAGVTAANIHAEVKTGPAVGSEAL
jgi:hypothetical protein